MLAMVNEHQLEPFHVNRNERCRKREQDECVGNKEPIPLYSPPLGIVEESIHSLEENDYYRSCNVSLWSVRNEHSAKVTDRRLSERGSRQSDWLAPRRAYPQVGWVCLILPT